MKQLRFVVMTALFTLLSPTVLLACTCEIVQTGPSVTPRKWFERPAIFVGNALTIERLNSRPSIQRVLFVVEASWRRALPDTVTLIVGQNAPCAYYTAGGRYLVHAEAGETGTSSLSTAPCDVTLRLGHTRTTEMLGELGPPGWTAGAFGTRSLDSKVVRVGNDPGNQQEMVHIAIGFPDSEAITRIEIANQTRTIGGGPPAFLLPAGLYRMRVRWSDGHVSESYLAVRCDERDTTASSCYAFRYLTDVRVTLPTPRR